MHVIYVYMENEFIKYLSNYDKGKLQSKTSVMPLLGYAVLNNISAKNIHSYIIEGGYKVSLISIQRWKREAARWLGLAHNKTGRPSHEEQKKLRDAWHRVNGYPTLEMLFKGWQPVAKVDVNAPAKPSVNAPSNIKDLATKTGTQRPVKSRPPVMERENRFKGQPKAKKLTREEERAKSRELMTTVNNKT